MLGAKTPICLAQMAIGASLVTALCYPIDQMPWPHVETFRSGQLTLALLGFLALCGGGIAISLSIQQRLTNGLAAGIWSDEERDRAHRFVKLPIFRYGMVAFLIFYFGTMISHFVTGNHHASLLMVTIWPVMTLSRLMIILAPPKPTADRSRLANAAPLHSIHWGHRSSKA